MVFQGGGIGRSKVGRSADYITIHDSLNERGAHMVRCKTKTRKKADVMRWLRDGIELFKNESGDLSRDFWIGRALVIESELGFPNQSHAFWSCANKVMPSLLFQAEKPECHWIRPHSQKVTTISTLITAVIIKGQADLSQLAIQGNYGAVAAQDMDKVYSRHMAHHHHHHHHHHQICVSRLAQKSCQGNRGVEFIADGPPGISEECLTGKKSTRADFLGRKPVDRAIDILKKRGNFGRLKK